MYRLFYRTFSPIVLVIFTLSSCLSSHPPVEEVARNREPGPSLVEQYKQASKDSREPGLAANPGKIEEKSLGFSAGLAREQAGRAPESKSLAMRHFSDMSGARHIAPLHPPIDPIILPTEPTDRENYAHFDNNPIRRVAEIPVSTFSIDVDTGSYTNVRRFLNNGRLPVKDAVRVEEMINYFSYAYPTPTDVQTPFQLTTEIAPTPWNPHTHLLHIGIKGYEVPQEELPPANLVFLIDVSGSMQPKDKLDLVKLSLSLLSKQLEKEDSISLVVYAGASGVVLKPTPGNQTAEIRAAIGTLTAGGSTNGASGIRLAYDMAEQAFIKNGINRVILATDGDFNVGTVNIEALKNLIEEKRKSGISLTTLGVGTGNYNDHLMEQLADVGQWELRLY